VSDAELPASLEALVGASDALPHLVEALTHPSFANEQRRGDRIDYQRLEFLGDAVLQLCVTELLVERFPDAGEGELSRRRAAIVGTEALATYARSHDLGGALRMGRGADASGERGRSNVLADALEAVVAAVYLDRGFDVARSLARAMAESAMERQKDALDPKSELQERAQGSGLPAPTYRLVGEEGPPHERCFVVRVEVDGRELGEGRGRSKKAAEQEAAREGLSNLSPAADRD
jgi:ribonuclease-3